MSKDLFNIARNKDLEIEEILYIIDKAVDLNVRDEHGYTPLMVASMNQNFIAAEALLDMGADIEVKTITGQTALTIAFQCENFSVVRLITDYKNWQKEKEKVQTYLSSIKAERKNNKTPKIKKFFDGVTTKIIFPSLKNKFN